LRYDPDRKKPVRQKLADAVQRYEEKFGRTATYCLTHPLDAADLAEPTRKHPGELPVMVEGKNYIGRWMFYVGEEGAETL
jgi:hypothetical protein